MFVRLPADAAKLMAPVQNRLTISLAGSTISSGIGLRPALISSRSPQRAKLPALVIAGGGKLLEICEIVLPERMLEFLDRLGVPHVVLAPPAPHDLAAAVELGKLGPRIARIGDLHSLHCLASENIQINSLDAAGRAGEERVDDRAAEANGLEDLCAAIALQGADSHLAEDLEQSGVDGAGVIVHRLLEREPGPLSIE